MVRYCMLSLVGHLSSVPLKQLTCEAVFDPCYTMYPTTRMLNVIGSSPTTPETRPFDYAGSYAFSVLRQDALRKIHESEEAACDSNKISFPSKYATSKKTQRTSVLRRTMKIYWRSPRYNLVRLMISGLVSLLFGTSV